MEWLTSLLGGGLNLMSGGLIGAISGIATGWLKLKEKRADQEHELRLREEERKTLVAEAENAVRLEQARAITAVEQGAADAFTVSQGAARVDIPAGLAEKASPWVANMFILGEFTKGMVRVFVTLVGFGYVIYFGMQGVAEAAKDGKLALTCVKSLIFIAEMACGWWFAHRQMTKQ